MILLATLWTMMTLDTLSVGEIKYQYKGEPFPYDSGVAISDRQFTFIQKQSKIKEVKSVIRAALERPPVVQVQYVDRIVEKKPHWTKRALGILGGVAIGIIASCAVK